MNGRSSRWLRMAATVVAGGTVFASAAATQPRVWNFSVSLDDKPIGYHRYTVDDIGSEHAMTTTARFDVKLLFVTVYHYSHDATERWQGNCLSELKASTLDDGVATKVDAQPDGAGLMVLANGQPRVSLAACVMSFAYWNPEILRQSSLLNAQTGEYEPIRVMELGTQAIRVRGSAVAATHYRIDGPRHPIDLWYSADRVWLALESTLDGGRRLRYRLE